jgi:hypothetical protein
MLKDYQILAKIMVSILKIAKYKKKLRKNIKKGIQKL